MTLRAVVLAALALWFSGCLSTSRFPAPPHPEAFDAPVRPSALDAGAHEAAEAARRAVESEVEARVAARVAEAVGATSAAALRAEASERAAIRREAEERATRLRAEQDAANQSAARFAAERQEREAQAKLERRMVWIGAALMAMAAAAVAVGLWFRMGLLTHAAGAAGAAAATFLCLGYAGEVMVWIAPALLLAVGGLIVWRLVRSARTTAVVADIFEKAADPERIKMTLARVRALAVMEANGVNGTVARIRGKPVKRLERAP